MAASVGGYPAHYLNTDPGVYEPECDWAEPAGYPDTEEVLAGMAAPGPEAAPPPAQPAQLPLAGDYQGLGGPTSVPLYSPAAFEQPARPVERTILDEIFLEPTDRQLDALYRVQLRAKV